MAVECHVISHFFYCIVSKQQTTNKADFSQLHAQLKPPTESILYWCKSVDP